MEECKSYIYIYMNQNIRLQNISSERQQLLGYICTLFSLGILWWKKILHEDIGTRTSMLMWTTDIPRAQNREENEMLL